MAVAPFGIIGGMGPLATAHFLRRVVELTPAKTDQDHLPIIAYSVPQIPDRSLAIMGAGPSPLPALLAGVRTLRRSNVQEIVLVCNTAYHWYPELSAAAGVPIVHIADAVLEELGARGSRGPIGLLATPGALASGFYQQKFRARGVTLITPTVSDQETFMLPGVAAVKRGDLTLARCLFLQLVESIKERGANIVILGCTEFGVTLLDDDSAYFLDSSEALARHCVRRWHIPSGK